MNANHDEPTAAFVPANPVRWHSDPGHEWLEVSVRDLRGLGIERQISRYSYLRGGYAYLEGDCDAGRYYDAIERNGGAVVLLAESYTDGPSPVRSMQSYSVDAIRNIR